MVGLAAGMEGYLLRKVTVPFRLLAVAGGLLLINPSTITDIIGFGIVAFVIVIQIIGKRKETIVNIVKE
jgi:TRAP-type uncharacterized transport system fused permease subunit